MTNSTYIQNQYMKLYAYLRDYIWNPDEVDMIAEVEIEAFKSIPDMEKLRQDAQKLQKAIKEILKEDEDFSQEFDKFINVLDDDKAYTKLVHPKEVSYENSKEK